MARNLVTVTEVVNDFILSLDSDDYANNVSDTLVHNYALRGIREMGFDMLQRVRSIKLSKSSNDTVELPDDFVSLVKIGVVGSDGLLYVLGENSNINISQKYKTTAGGTRIDTDGDGVYDREDAKTGSTPPGLDLDDALLFNNYVYQNSVGQIYGLGGGFYQGQYRVNYDQNRIELALNSAWSDIVIEYVADEARSTNPTIHIMAEEALRCYIYYKVIERKSNVPANEKARARQEYYNERRKANSRLMSFTKEEALKTIRKNFKQTPKY